MLSIKECRKILTDANPDRAWSDEDIERLRGALYEVARLALSLPSPDENHETPAHRQAA